MSPMCNGNLIIWMSSGLAILAAVPVSVRADAPKTAAVIQQYCVACHNAKLKTAGLSLSQVDVSKPGEQTQVDVELALYPRVDLGHVVPAVEGAAARTASRWTPRPARSTGRTR